jgi:hypothetical protein
MADDVVRIKTGMQVSYIANSTREDVVEIPRAEWDAMTPEQQQETLDSIAEGFVADYLGSWAYVDKED